MPEVDYAVLSEWFDWISSNISIPVDLIGDNTQSTTPTQLLINVVLTKLKKSGDVVFSQNSINTNTPFYLFIHVIHSDYRTSLTFRSVVATLLV